MQLTQATDYSFRTIYYLASQEKGVITSAQDIADHEVIPFRFLLKIMRPLIKAGLVKSHRGTTGGYSLAKSPQEIFLLDIVVAVEGPVSINRCLDKAEYCSKNFTKHCPFHQVLGEVQKLITDKFSQVTINDLLQK